MAAQARFSRESYDRLRHELESLKGQRASIVQDIKEAREQGDLRENFAYHAAKDAQGLLEARITSLEARLGDAIVVEAGSAVEEVMMGIPVTVRELGNGGGVRIYNIVAEEELDLVDDAASADSPIGSALLGKRQGDVVEVQGPRGVVQFEITSIGA